MPETPSPQEMNIPVNIERLTANLLQQLSQAQLAAAQWKAVAEEWMETAQAQQQIIEQQQALVGDTNGSSKKVRNAQKASS